MLRFADMWSYVGAVIEQDRAKRLTVLAKMDAVMDYYSSVSPGEYFKRMVNNGLIWDDGSYRGGPHISKKEGK